MKKYLELLKKLWADEKGRALVKLGIYLIFIIFVIGYARALNDNDPSTKVVGDNFYSKTTYDASINVNNDIYELSYYKYINLKKDEINYSIENNKVLYYGEEQANYDVYFWNITPKLIKDLIKDNDSLYVTNFQNGEKEEGYQIDLIDFIKVFNGKIIDVENIEELTEKISLSIISKDDKVDKIKMDLTSYYKFITRKEDNYNIEIDYK